MSGKHPKRDRVAEPAEPPAAFRGEPAAREFSAAEVRAQMAILAEQVRQLGKRVGDAVDSQPDRDAPPPSLAPGAYHRSATVDSAPVPEPTPDKRRAPPPPPHAGDTVDDHTARLFASVIATAERAAAEIHARAEREAARIRGAGSKPCVAPPTELVDSLERQRQTLAAFASETDRIAHATATLRAQTRALDAERRRMYEALTSARRRQ
jgi:hypothetical protein